MHGQKQKSLTMRLREIGVLNVCVE
uniref:Uncharacterized protein n=1 Tax=Anguilla anguilla TaxID=7936 RepID=A0A0E9PK67_ANGAN